MSHATQNELSVSTLNEKPFGITKAKATLACLAHLSSCIQGSTSLSLYIVAQIRPPPFIVNDEGYNDYIWRCHKLIPASVAKSCSPPDYAKQADMLHLWSGGEAAESFSPGGNTPLWGNINQPGFTQRSATWLTSMKAHFNSTARYFKATLKSWWHNDALASQTEATFSKTSRRGAKVGQPIEIAI